ncbi:MAG: hypothetical protein QOE33_2443 [Acidobacteriota bacterium]|nr:hypothetical protein [Acidobacteriota bacterium]
MRKLSLLVLPLLVFLAPFGSRLAALRRAASGATTVASSAGGEAARHARARISRARKLLENAPDPAPDSTTLAAEDANGEQIHVFTLPKATLLQQGATAEVSSSLGAQLKVTVVRANYVNTSLRVTDDAGRELVPLLVKYPRTEGERVKEIAYYTSAHPALAAPALTRDGRLYVRATLDSAAADLRDAGEKIDPSVVDVAERLCVVEHTDHKRFLSEDHAAIFNEIDTLYALNAGDTYRYSVSTAGAGGMIQMIPKTYDAIRDEHPRAALETDFVTGMQDHSNAARAMLLYLQDTWDGLSRREQIKQALATNLATQAELLAAGYNSNPMRLASYLEKGGSSWRTLIPAETQMYLQIYAAVDRLAMNNLK